MKRMLMIFILATSWQITNSYQTPRINDLIIVSISNSCSLKISCDEIPVNPTPIEPPVGTKLP